MNLQEALLAIIFAILIGAVVKHWITGSTLSATENDWFIAVDSNVQSRQVILTFYPILAFRQQKRRGYCMPITSCPHETDPLLGASHVTSGSLAVSTSEKYGRWFRHGFRYNTFGALCWSGLHFWQMVHAYRSAGFAVLALNPPPEYEDWIREQTRESQSPEHVEN